MRAGIAAGPHCRPPLAWAVPCGCACHRPAAASSAFALDIAFVLPPAPGRATPDPRKGDGSRERSPADRRTISTLPALLPASHCMPSAGPLLALGWALIPPAATPLPVLAPRSRRNTARERTAPRFGRDLSAVRAGWKVRVCRSCERRAFAFQPPRAAGLPGSSGAVCQPG
jgi:hypothetical protein